jgi:predicted DNA-binding transcriptional regulator AlpA
LEAVVVSLRGAGHMLGYGRKKIYQLIAEGHLVSFKDKKARRITVASIHEHINRCMAASADSKPKRPA